MAVMMAVVADMEELTGVEARRTHPMSIKGTAATTTRTGSEFGSLGRSAASRRHGFHPSRDEASCGYRGGRLGDRINAVLAAAGHNFGLFLLWLAKLLCAIIRAFAETVPA
jgi:IS5 family transposase